MYINNDYLPPYGYFGIAFMVVHVGLIQITSQATKKYK
jgi:hypothetical protein